MCMRTKVVAVASPAGAGAAFSVDLGAQPIPLGQRYALVAISSADGTPAPVRLLHTLDNADVCADNDQIVCETGVYEFVGDRNCRYLKGKTLFANTLLSVRVETLLV